MSKVIMGVGLPGSGKTTFLKPFAEQHGYTYISPDTIRHELTGDEADQSRNREVWEEAHKRVAEALAKGETVVMDATFAKDFERKDFITFARSHGATKVQGVFANVPLEIAGERNRDRERVVPEHAMHDMNTRFEKAPPVVEDGFDSVTDINEFQEINRGEMIVGENEKLTREYRTKLR